MKASKIRILIADDELRLLKSQKDLLELHGYDTDAAQGGKAAIARLKKEHYDILLLDLMMPDLGGHDVMDFMRTNDLDTTVIVISGDASIDSAIGSLRRGAYDYLRKPYATEELLKRIENAVRKRHLEEENRSINARLQHSEKLYRYMVNSSPDIIYMLDKDGRFTFINERIESLLGHTRDELLGQHYSILIYPEDRDIAERSFDERRTGERATRNLELRLKAKDTAGSTRHLEDTAVSIELSAMGMYANPAGKSEKQYTGTYGVIRDVTERKKAEEIIRYQAYHDLLTGLPNRTLFKDRLGLAISQARRNEQELAVMFLDLDRFKLVNDTLGHVRGDELLQAVAVRLRECLREGDTVARVGGDEFMLLIPQIGERQDAADTAFKIISELKRPFTLEGQEFFVSSSIGISVFPQDGETMDILIKNADIAMYHMKEQGRDGYEFYTRNMDARFSNYLSLESGMRKALEDNQFRLLYQPQVNLRTGEIAGMETLLRWQHPTRGLLGPAEFIPYAEESGLIVPIGEWVIERACADVQRWHKAGLSPVKVAVNLSALQFEQQQIVEDIIDMVDEEKVPGCSLEIEITENAIMKDMESVVHKLMRLSRHGVQIAVDDFGTGYSSLSYLHKLPIDTIKIDRSFVHDIAAEGHESSIVNAIVAMAKGLGLNIVAEGVESQVQVDYLLALECDVMQGFLFSKPLLADEAAKLLRKKPFTVRTTNTA